MIKISPTRKLYAIGGTSIAVIAAVIALVMVPLYGKVSTLKQEIGNERIQLEIQKREKTNLEQTRADYNKIKNDIDNISQVFVNQDGLLEIISKFESIATANGVTQKLDVDTEGQSTAAKTLTIHLTLTCTWQSCLQYLSDVEQLDYYASIKNLNMTYSNGQLTTTFIAELYGQ